MRKNKKRKCERRAGRRKSRRQIRARTSPATPGFFFFSWHFRKTQNQRRAWRWPSLRVSTTAETRVWRSSTHTAGGWPERNSSGNGPRPTEPEDVRLLHSGRGRGQGRPVGQAMHVIPGGIVHIVFSVKGVPGTGSTSPSVGPSLAPPSQPRSAGHMATSPVNHEMW